MLNVLLCAMFLAGVAGATILGGTSPNRDRLASDNNGARIASQVRLIAGELTACSVNYPAGNNGTAYRVTYPAATTAVAATTLTCPGKPAGSNALFATLGAAGSPPTINGFGAWQFVNDATSSRLTLTASSTDGAAALTQAAFLLGAQATAASTTLTFVVQF